MKLIKLKPTSNGTRNTVKIQKNLLAKSNRIVKSLLLKKKISNGRSSLNGRITVRHKGSGVKNLYRKIHNTSKEIINQDKNLLVVTNCYDPNRNAFINLNFDLDRKTFSFNTATDSIYPGTLIRHCLNTASLTLGYRTQLKNIPTGTLVHNLTIDQNLNTKYIRSAGTYGVIIQCDDKIAKIILPSKKIITLKSTNLATIGVISNTQSNLTKIGKAGINRRLGIRPTVRGIAMNPVDHPHGGRTNGGMPSVSPWGKPTKCGYSLKRKTKLYKIKNKNK